MMIAAFLLLLQVRYSNADHKSNYLATVKCYAIPDNVFVLLQTSAFDMLPG